ncbi:hypothetical protein [Gordonia sp. WA4-43]|uniref:hypothetical protein n=1 Tax=Gordonia sp. WA4-43 TaxID=2878678 RepID=UPI001CF99FEC|nr:hypothetical protein [Gordonia sp. WA4-43]UCZ89860.1 hypothetical protein LEL84_23130 [Gordonia sp. WA4-43]
MTAADTPEAGPPVIPVGRFEWERIIREDATLSTKLKAVAFVFATHARTAEGDRIFPGNDQLARGASMSLATFKRHRDELVRRGLLQKAKQGNRHRNLADEWRLTMPDLIAPAAVPARAGEQHDVQEHHEDVLPERHQPDTPAAEQRDDAHSEGHHPGEGIPTPYERARRRVEAALAGLDAGTPEFDQARAELVHELSMRVTPTEVRELLGLSELEYRAAKKRRRSA